VTAQDNDGSTPLHFAVWVGNLDPARLLVDHGADVTLAAQDIQGSTPLHRAVKEGSVDLARLLVMHGADVSAKDNQK
jgi:ankyrin repeat protein